MTVCQKEENAFEMYRHPQEFEKCSHDPLAEPDLQGRNRRGGGAWSSLQGPARHWASVVLLMSLKDHGHHLLNHKNWRRMRPTEEGPRGLHLNYILRRKQKPFGRQFSSARNFTSKSHQLCCPMGLERRSSLYWSTPRRFSTVLTSSCA